MLPTLQLDCINPALARLVWKRNRIIKTERGPEHIRAHILDPENEPNHGGIYRCGHCRMICCWCFGAADKEPALCDDCVALGVSYIHYSELRL